MKRLRRKPLCGRLGHLVVGVDELTGEIVKLKRANHSCRSVHCPYCQVRESRKRLSTILTWFSHLLDAGERLSFITITIPSSHNIFEHIAQLKKAFERFYQMRIGRRAWEQISEEFFAEVKSYVLNLRELGYSEEEIERRVKRQLYFFEQFEKYVIAGLDDNAKVKDVFRSAVWKFELTYSGNAGYHAHFHGITTVFMPKLLLTVLLKRAGLGAVCDIRELRGRQGLVELTKYETKYWELEGLTFEEKLAVEVALLGFKKFRVWGEVERYSDDEERVRYFPLISARVGLKCSFIEKFKKARSTGKDVEVDVVIDNETFVASFLRSNEVPVQTYRFEGVGLMDRNGEIDLTNFLEVEGFRDFLRACLVMFDDFIHLCCPQSVECFLRKSRVVLDALESAEVIDLVEGF
ncbi:MAG: protein rep [Gammaproteobacteria bacterium]|nr:protein rep [Gammaproteobacteria bacterium]